jgi:CDP-diacylglycerol--glycerol-3-phosphate 3-phosphatidyltransferase
VLRHLPNALSAARIVAAPVLVVLAARGMLPAFTWLLVAALLSDIADGLIARAFGLAAGYGVWVFHPELVTRHYGAALLLAAAWLTEIVAALWRYGRLSSFHTYLSKAAGYLLGIFVGALFVFGFQPWLLYLGVAVSVLGNLEELALIALLPQWRADVRGLWWVLRERRGARA